MGAHVPVPSAPQERAQQHVAGLRYLDEGRQAVVAIATVPPAARRRAAAASQQGCMAGTLRWAGKLGLLII
eukprot:COSAG01_NODE_1009_length_12151_cov_18.810571_8_plen_71_part_00